MPLSFHASSHEIRHFHAPLRPQRNAMETGPPTKDIDAPLPSGGPRTIPVGLASAGQRATQNNEGTTTIGGRSVDSFDSGGQETTFSSGGASTPTEERKGGSWWAAAGGRLGENPRWGVMIPLGHPRFREVNAHRCRRARKDICRRRRM